MTSRFIAFTICLTAWLSFPSTAAAVAFQEAFHRHGQTFLTWEERADLEGEEYWIYRTTEPPTAAALSSLEPIARLQEGSSIAEWDRKHYFGPYYSNFQIHDIDSGHERIGDGTGLLVWTPGEIAGAWYAIALAEDPSAGPNWQDWSSTGPITETADPPRPVLVARTEPEGLGRLYVQYMDLRTWNETLIGYGLAYHVMLPENFDPEREYPLFLDLHALGLRHAFDDGTSRQAIVLAGDDPRNTWWYGWSATHDFNIEERPTTGPVENFMEQALLRAVHDTIANPEYPVDPERVVAAGFSMGGSGALSLGIRYPDVFSAVYSNMGMTNYRRQEEPGPRCANPINWIETGGSWLYGWPERGLPIRNRSPWLGADGPSPAAHLGEFNGTDVWDWWDHGKMLNGPLLGRETAFIQLDHGSVDCTISWDTQAVPFLPRLEEARVGYSALTLLELHLRLDYPGRSPGLGPDARLPGQQDFAGNNLEYEFRHPRSRSFPAISRNSANGTFPPPPNETSHYNTNVLWAAPWYEAPYQGELIDEPSAWEVTLFAVPAEEDAEAQPLVADVTPRRLQRFRPAPGTILQWSARDAVSGQRLASGIVPVESTGLFTAPEVPVMKEGTLLRFEGPLSVSGTWILY